MARTHFMLVIAPVDVGSKEQVFVKIEPGYPDATEARKDFKSLQPGCYELHNCVEEGIVIEPPALSTTNVVIRGKTFIHRALKADHGSQG